MKKIKILTVFGTRPEVIKLAPFIKEVQADADCISVTCATTQHNELQHEVLNLFKIKADYDLDVMKDGQDLIYITEVVLNRIRKVLQDEKPDFVVVQGDTTTAFTAALSAFYCKIPVVHVEAGLRTGNIYYPYPEEMNRILLSRIASLHMAPTQKAVDNLAKEGDFTSVFKVGNTIVDAVDWVIKNHPPEDLKIQEILKRDEKKVLVTVHRRENFGEPLKKICTAIIELSYKYPECIFIWPVHPNPNVKKYVHETMGNMRNVILLEPISYFDLINVLNKSDLILSDSGGIQEEACILGKNIIILRNETERPEVVESGFGVLAGADSDKIQSYFKKMIVLNESAKDHTLKHVFGKPGVSLEILSLIKKSYQNNDFLTI
jgi:UDP-N-acetylglucosamine 2-epimerase (non-hydrolysing)